MNRPTLRRGPASAGRPTGPGPRRARRLRTLVTVLALAATALGLTGAPPSTAVPVPPVTAMPVTAMPVTAAPVTVPPTTTAPVNVPPATATPVTVPPARAQQVVVPAGVTAGVAVFDRTTGTFAERLNETMRFRAASVVKLLIALDYLRTRDPRTLPAADRTRLDSMLRSSDDNAAGYYWDLGGRTAIVDRTAAQLGLTDTVGPPAGYESYWGYVSLSAADTVRIYRYLLDTAPAPVRDYVMGNLRQSTRCGTDGFDQHFGIAGSFTGPWAVKQGWSGFGGSGSCSPRPSTTVPLTGQGPAATSAGGATPAAAGTARAAASVDLTREALHTTGTVGSGDRSIVAVLTLHADGTPYGTAYSAVNRLVRSLNVPGAVRPPGTWFGTWGSGVNVRQLPSTTSARLTTLPAGVEVLVGCQKLGQQVSVPPYSNAWWAYLPQYGGWMTNIYVSSPDDQLPGVPLCAS